MTTPLGTRPEWAAVIAEHAVDDETARKLIGQLVSRRGVVAGVLPAARALGAAAMPTRARPAAARQRCAGQPTGSRPRSPGSSVRSGATCSSWRPTTRRGGRGSASRARPSSSIGSRCSNAPASGSRRIAWRTAYLELAVLVRALEGLSAQARWQSSIDTSSLWAGLFDLRENLLGRAHDDLRAIAA